MPDNPTEDSTDKLNNEDKSEEQSKENEENSDDTDSESLLDLTNKIPGMPPVTEPQKKPIGPDLP